MAVGRAVETLDRTGGFNVKAVRHRLLETTQHTINVHRDLKSIQPGGDGFVDSVRIRLVSPLKSFIPPFGMSQSPKLP